MPAPSAGLAGGQDRALNSCAKDSGLTSSLAGRSRPDAVAAALSNCPDLRKPLKRTGFMPITDTRGHFLPILASPVLACPFRRTLAPFLSGRAGSWPLHPASPQEHRSLQALSAWCRYGADPHECNSRASYRAGRIAAAFQGPGTPAQALGQFIPTARPRDHHVGVPRFARRTKAGWPSRWVQQSL